MWEEGEQTVYIGPAKHKMYYPLVRWDYYDMNGTHTTTPPDSWVGLADYIRLVVIPDRCTQAGATRTVYERDELLALVLAYAVSETGGFGFYTPI